MTYEQNSDLPKGVRNNLPAHAQDIYREAFNHAWNSTGPQISVEIHVNLKNKWPTKLPGRQLKKNIKKMPKENGY